MSLVNIDKIINGTPRKRILNAYNTMKENYNEQTAQEFKDVYIKESLSSILESSRLIFSEPYFGLDYYKEVMETVSDCGFSHLYEESDKIHGYLEDNEELMSTEQRKIYEEATSLVDDLLAHRKNATLFADYIKEHVDDSFESNLLSLVESYRKDSKDENVDAIIECFESVENPLVYFTYSPFICKLIGESGKGSKISSLAFKFCSESVDESEDSWTNFTESVICMNKLKNDSSYLEAMQYIPSKNDKIIFEYFMDVDISEKLEEMRETVVTDDVTSPDPVSAVNRVFSSITESVDEKNIERKTFLDTLEGIAYESTLNILLAEYQESNDTKQIATGYTLIKEELSIDDAFEKTVSLYQEKVGTYMESSEKEDEEDVSDEDIDNVDNDNDDKEKKESTGKKPKAPEAKNLANRIQIKAMDKEAKQMKNRSIRQQKGQEAKNAAKAVVQIPKNVVDSIKDQVHKIDEADDERRKNFMTTPGFRKKAFQNLKLAILYGTAAQAKLALVPVVAIGRHFSKEKDRRIRNETVREIQTEIRVCEEKISDANSNGDQKEKYRLMRIKDQLDAELIRVKTNSKYV